MATIKQNLLRRLKEKGVLYRSNPNWSHHLNSYNLFVLQRRFIILEVDNILWRSIYNKYWKHRKIRVLAPKDKQELHEFLNYLTEGGISWSSGHAMNELFPWEQEGQQPFAFDIHDNLLDCTWTSWTTRSVGDLTVKQFKSFFELFKKEMNENADKLFKVC